MVIGRSIPMSLATGSRPVGMDRMMTRQHENPADLHSPVMLAEVVQLLRDVPEGIIVDATLGMGGHAEALLEARQDMRLIGFDRDAESLELADLRLARWSSRYELVHADFRTLPELAASRGWTPIAGLVADLGISSLQLDSPERGFSFMRDGSLDMRMNRQQPRTAAELVNRLSFDDLRTLLRDFGDEPHATRIARAIVRQREVGPIHTTLQLAQLVADVTPQRGPQRVHPATRTFQALRIAVNDEIRGIYEFVIEAARLLASGGRLGVVAFHSLEDRAVKRAMRYLASECECPPEIPCCVCDKHAEVKILTRRPLYPSAAEITSNPRARSARLRALQKI